MSKWVVDTLVLGTFGVAAFGFLAWLGSKVGKKN